MNSKKPHNDNNINTEELEDFSKVYGIIKSLDFLKKEAKLTKDEEIILIVNSAFNLCFAAYYTALKLKAVNALCDDNDQQE